MMTTVAQELEKMKFKMTEMEETKVRIPEMNNKILIAENNALEFQCQSMDLKAQCNQLRADMQHLNDMYSNERQLHVECQNEIVDLVLDNFSKYKFQNVEFHILHRHLQSLYIYAQMLL